MMTADNKFADTGETIFIGKGEQSAWLTLGLANRHGLVTGATGTGKTVSLQVMAEGFARAGVPVFAADIKGDLSGISEVGEPKDLILKRAADMGLTFKPDQFSTVFWDVFGEQGHPVRATVSEMGPLLLSRMMDLNDVQEGVLNIAFRVADEQGLLLLDMKDLRSILSFIAEHAAELTTQYGNVSKQTVGTIQRQLLVLENQGGTKFFGEPGAARAAGLHSARSEGGRGGRADVPAQSETQYHPGHHRIGQGRSAGVVPRRQRHAGDGRARNDPAAHGADRTDNAGGTQGDHGQEPGEGQIRHHRRFRIRL